MTWTPIVISACRRRGICAPRRAVQSARSCSSWYRTKGRGGQRDAQLVGPEARATGAPEAEGEFQFLQAILTVAAAVDVDIDPLGVCRRFMMTKRGLSRGSRPWCHTTSALMMMRRGAAQVPAW